MAKAPRARGMSFEGEEVMTDLREVRCAVEPSARKGSCVFRRGERRDGRGFAYAEFFEHGVEHRCEEEAEECDADHASEQGDTHRAAHPVAGPGAHYER